jgi:DNA-binding beta-propeller fold protein YncE
MPNRTDQQWNARWKMRVGAALTALAVVAAGRAMTLRANPPGYSGRPAVTPSRGTDGKPTRLFNGWKIRPTGHSLHTGDMLLGGAVSPDGTTFAIANCGYNRHAVSMFDVATEQEFESFPVAHAGNGLAWSPDGRTFYAAGGVAPDGADIYVYSADGDRWERRRTLTLPHAKDITPCTTGLALASNGKTLYALDLDAGTLNVVDVDSGATRATLTVGDHPIQCRLMPDGRQLWIANLGGKELVAVDVHQPEHPVITRRQPTGDHPNDLALSRDGRLFVSCGNADTVWIHNAASGEKQEVFKTAFNPHGPLGSTPNALAVTPDARTLYVANADNNAVCVVDISHPDHSRVKGFVPTGWYPTAVAVSADGHKLLIGSGKGTGSRPNPGLPAVHPTAPADYKFEYTGRQLNGLVSFLPAPTGETLDSLTRLATANSPYEQRREESRSAERPTAIPMRIGDPSPIKHVLYIIKENRTYDQVFGDLKQGNGDPALCLFDRRITPNHHKLAEQFVLLDNLYCNGEVSEDGHRWCDGALVVDFVQRNWVLEYSGKSGMSESETVTTPGAGYLWDACKRHGLTYRSYGEGLDATSSLAAPEQKLEGAPGLIGHGSEKYVGIGFPAGKEMRDTDKADVFIQEFRDYERKGTVPQFMVMSLGEDHTSGTRPGSFTPQASVASNDLALGRIVEAISKSSLWRQFAIFVIEDDAQNGPDHVDSHRTAGLVISPYVRRHWVDSTMYSTVSMLRTMELILGLPPLTQYDAGATPMFESFTAAPNLTPYIAEAPHTDLAARNTPHAYGARESARMDFSAYDRADPDELNRILWHSIRGRDVPMPVHHL